MGIGRHELTPTWKSLQQHGRDRNGDPAKAAPPRCIKEHLTNLLAKSPAPERQVGRGRFGQCSGREGTGLNCAVLSTFWRGLEWGVQEGGWKEGSFTGWVFCSFKSGKRQWSLPLWIHVFRIRIFEKGWGLFRDRCWQTWQRVELKTKGHVKAGPQPPKLKVSGFWEEGLLRCCWNGTLASPKASQYSLSQQSGPALEEPWWMALKAVVVTPRRTPPSWLWWSVFQVQLGGKVILNSFLCHHFRNRRKLRLQVKTTNRIYASFTSMLISLALRKRTHLTTWQFRSR